MKNNQLAMALGAATLAIGATVGVASFAHAAPTATPSATTTASASATPKHQGTTTAKPTADGSQHPGRHKGGQQGGDKGSGQALGGMAVKDLAQALGTDETKTKEAVQQARKDVQAARKANANLTAAEAKDVAETSIAKSLGVDKAKVTAAVDQIMAKHKTQSRDELKAKLDQAVKDGKITQADEDSILKAYDAGVLPGHR